MIAWRKSSRSGSNDDSSCVEVAELWRKSSRSGSVRSQDCVEVAGPCGCGERVIGVRDSKDPDGPKLWLSPVAWAALVQDIKTRSL
ncbi:MAG: hypothetical protein JWN52_4498 [Actinomycetia bacterium]|nr:hypothetical protein [Actinomycetes bacterium]